MDLCTVRVKEDGGVNHRLSQKVVAVLLAAFGAVTPGQAQDTKEAFTAEQVSRGAKLYAQNCEVCHGSKMVETGGGFFDLRTFPKHQRSRFINSVSNGKNSMPPWKSLLSQEEIGDLWSYVVTGEAQ